MAMQFLHNSAKSGFLKYILLGFLALAGGGLVLSDVGGFFRGGLGSGDVARVGSEKISIVSFDRTLRNTLVRLGISPAQAFQAGYMDEILRGQMRDLVMKHAAVDEGILVGKKYVAERINEILTPLVQDGQTKEDVLRQVLAAQGMNESQMVASMAVNFSTDLLNNTVKSGFSSPLSALVSDMKLYEGEKRDIKLLSIPYDSLEIPNDPSPEDLVNLYETYKERYAIPETRVLKVVKLKNDDLKKTIEITDEHLRSAYDENIAAYTVAETRTLQQALLSSADDAQKVVDAVKKGKTLEAAAKAVSDTSYLGENDFTKDGVLEEIKEAAFSAEKDAVVGPVETDLGWQVLVVKGIKAPYTKKFEDVSAALKEELLEVALADQMYNLSASMEDLLAGGASLEEVQNEIPLEITSLTDINRFGTNKDEKNLLESDELSSNREFILSEGFALLEGETSLVRETEGGDFIAVNVASITPKSYPAPEEIKSKLIERWINDQRQKTAQTKAQAFATLAENSEKTLEQIHNDETGLSLTAPRGITRTGDIPAPLLQGTIENIFNANIDDFVVLPVLNGFAVVQVVAAELPETSETSNANESLTNDLQNEALILFLEEKQKEYNAVVNRGILARYYGSEAQEF